MTTDAATSSSSAARWPSQWAPEVRDRAAVAAFVLLLSTGEWVHRRVERIAFVDENSIRRHVSVDFTLPDLDGDLPGLLHAERVGGAGVCYVPLTLLRKRNLLKFDLRAEDGSALPFLSRRQNGQIAARMLELLAETLLGGQPLAVDVREDLNELACAPQQIAVEALGRLTAPGEDGASATQRKALIADPMFLTLAEELTNNHLLLVPLPAQPGARRVLKFAYEERPGAPVASGRLERLAERMNWRPVPLLLPASALGDCASSHVEIEVPEDLEIETVRALDLRGPVELAAGGLHATSQDYEGLQGVHLHFGELARDTWGLIELGLSVRRAGLLAMSVGASLLTAVMLTVGMLHLDGLAAHADAGSALLVAVPGVFAGFVLRPGEHPLVSRLFGGLRVVVFVSALCALAAAVSMALGLAVSELKLVWWPATAAAWVSCALLAASVVLPLERFRRRSERLARLIVAVSAPVRGVLHVGGKVRGVVRRRARGPQAPPMNVRQAVSALGLDLHGTPVESAEGWRAGDPAGVSPAALDRLVDLAVRMRR